MPLETKPRFSRIVRRPACRAERPILTTPAGLRTIVSFLANVNFAICCRPSVCRLSVVCNVRAPYSGGCNFRQFSTAFGSQIYSDFGPIEGYISETLQDRR